MARFIPLDTPKALGLLDSHLGANSYITGVQATQDDVIVFQTINSAPGSKWPHIDRWYRHIDYFPESVRSSWPASQSPNQIVDSSSNCANGTAEDDFDLFSEQTEQEKEANAARAQATAQTENKVVQRSVVVLDVKPWDETADWGFIEQQIRALNITGLEWKASKLEDVAFGIKKLQIMCHIVDELVSIDADVIPQIESFEEHVQSVDIFAFNKL